MQKILTGTIVLLIQVGIQASACLPAVRLKQPIRAALDDVTPKIIFALLNMGDESAGASNGLRSISYEFCIPADARHLAEVQAIDPTIVHFAHSRGRIGCRRNQYLCIGGRTRDPRWREILLSLARLEYIDRIDQFFGE